MPTSQVLKHGIFLSWMWVILEQERWHRNHTLRNDGCDLMWGPARISEIDNDEAGEMSKNTHGFCQVSTCRLLEIKQHWRVVLFTKFVSDSIQSDLPLRRKATQDQNDFRSDDVDDITNLPVVQQEIDKLSNLKIIYSDGILTETCNDE